MADFQILCVTMHQKDFSKIEEMNIHSDVIFANQADHTGADELAFEGHIARMITTDTRGVGINRNIALMYADADICIFADDDVTYVDDMESIVLKEFEEHPDADVMIFHFDTDDPVRKQNKYEKTVKCGPVFRMPWGGIRIAFRLNSVRKANIWYTTLFGGGCKYPSGEDSMWLHDARKKGLTFYVSNKTIGKVSFVRSTWFTGEDEKFFFGKGAFYQAVHPNALPLWMIYFALRTRRGKMGVKEKIRCMRLGAQGYRNGVSFAEINFN